MSFNLFAKESTNNLEERERIVISGNPDYPPYMWRKGEEIVGLGPRIFKECFAKQGYELEFKYVGPWSRVQAYARQGKIDFISGCYINAERQTYMDYSAPYLNDLTSIFVPKGKTFSYKSWKDLIDKKGIVVFGESYGEDLDLFIAEKLRVKRTYSINEALDNLVSGKGDYLLFGHYPTIIAATLAGSLDKIEVLEKPAVIENMYIAVSKKSKYKDLIPKLNKKIEEYKAKGLIRKWTDQYLSQHIKEHE